MSFQTILIIGGTKEKRLEKALGLRDEKKGNVYDTIVLPTPGDEISIKIDHVRLLISQFSLPPYIASVKTALLVEMDNASMETQHALLKFLEEPPPYAYIVLTASKKEVLLPTILSRAVVVKLPEENKNDWKNTYTMLTSLFEKGSGERLSEAASIASSKETVQEWLYSSCQAVRRALLYMIRENRAENTHALRSFLRTVNRAIRTFDTSSTNPRLLVENLLLDLPRLPRLPSA